MAIQYDITIVITPILLDYVIPFYYYLYIIVYYVLLSLLFIMVILNGLMATT